MFIKIEDKLVNLNNVTAILSLMKNVFVYALLKNETT